jgi:hypothetical protein
VFHATISHARPVAAIKREAAHVAKVLVSFRRMEYATPAMKPARNVQGLALKTVKVASLHFGPEKLMFSSTTAELANVQKQEIMW